MSHLTEPTRARAIRILRLVFFFSGFASLMYQVAWQRVLSTYYGVGSVATTIVVSVFLLGLGLGSLLGGRLAEHVIGRVRAYVLVEAALGVFGLLSLPLLELIGRHTAGGSYVVSLASTALFLGLPTLLMGATLPLLAKIFSQLTRDFLGSVGALYYVNTLGAGAGSLAASYGVISFLGLDWAVWLAAATNLVLAGAIWHAGQFATPARAAGSGAPAGREAPAQNSSDGALGRLALPIVFLTGFLAIGYEIAWFRLTGVLLKSSPYSFSTVLAVYLLGVALGSRAVERRASRLRRADLVSLFFLLQVLIGAYVLASTTGYSLLTEHTPLGSLARFSFGNTLHPDFVAASGGSVAALAQSLWRWIDVLAWPLAFLFVPTFLMGACFPLASSLALADRTQEGRTVGSVYATTIAGNVVGGAATGFLLLPWIGTGDTLLAFALVQLLMLAGVRRVASRPLGRPARAGAFGVMLALALTFFPRGDRLYRTIHAPADADFDVRVDEGVDTTVVSIGAGPFLRLFMGGLEHGGRPGPMFAFEALVTASAVERARDVLVVGFGTGAITEALLAQNEVQRLVLVELSETLLRHLEDVPDLLPVFSDPRLERILDDGRRYLYRSDERFDLVLTDPLRTTTAYSNNLYSREYLETIAAHLTERGVVMVWTDELHVVPRTVATVFEHVLLFRFQGGESGFCLASNAPFDVDEERLARLLAALPSPLREWTSRFAANAIEASEDRSAILARTAGWPINRDLRPCSEYYLGLSMHR